MRFPASVQPRTPRRKPASELPQATNEPASIDSYQTEFEFGQSVVVQKTAIRPGLHRRRFALLHRSGTAYRQLFQRAGRRLRCPCDVRANQDKPQAKKNPKQLMDAWDLKMHKPWW